MVMHRDDFSENSVGVTRIRGRINGHVSAWETLKPTEAVLSIIKEGYKLPLLAIPQSCVFPNNKSAIDNCMKGDGSF